MTEHSRNPRLPLWLRLWLYVDRQADPDGRLICERGTLREELAIGVELRSADVSRAIAVATTKGLLAPGSTARCLMLQERRHG